MATKKPMKKFKRYDEGGSVEEAMAKQRGLDMSNKEAPVGFFERIRAGNIDQPGSEAYNRFGAGRGRDRGESVSVNQPMPSAPSMPAASSRPLSDDMYSDFGPSAGRSSSETITPTRRPMATKPVVPAKPTATPVPSLSNSGPMRGMRSDASSPQYAGPLRGMRSDAGTSPPIATHGGPRDEEKSASAKIPGQSVKAPQGEKIDSSETGRNVGNALMATGVAGLGALGAYKAKKMYDAAKAAKKASSTKKIGMDTKKLSGPRKDSDVTDVDAKKRGGAVKKYASGGMVSSASRRADGIATKGKTRCKIC
jgi:hypothetical protein